MDAVFAPRMPAATPELRARTDGVRNFAFQALAVLAVALGGWYLAWRWSASLNPEALGFAVVVAAAETLAFVGAVLFFCRSGARRIRPRARRRARSTTSAPSRSRSTGRSAST